MKSLKKSGVEAYAEKFKDIAEDMAKRQNGEITAGEYAARIEARKQSGGRKTGIDIYADKQKIAAVNPETAVKPFNKNKEDNHE